MVWALLEIKEAVLSAPPPPSSNLESDSFSFGNKVSPSILLIIIILAIIFFVSGLLHLLIRFLLRPPSRDTDDLESVTVLQGQLQQLFHLHDAGVDQSFIDTLPVFNYKAIIGLKNPFDCAVCLCEFEPEDQLRLLPKCSHAFHMECIDTWLLSHSTCPLCRSTLLPEFSQNNTCSPIVLVLESGSVENSREINVSGRDHLAAVGRTGSVLGPNSQLGLHGDMELGLSQHKSCEIMKKDEGNPNPAVAVDQEEKVVQVKLGKFRNVDGGEGSSNRNVDVRRCFSMGSFAYVMDENSSLQVPIRRSTNKQSSKKSSFPLEPGHRQAMSECDFESRREFKFNGADAIGSLEMEGTHSASITSGNGIGRSKRESFSISKIWLRNKNEKPNVVAADLSRRAFSFRFPGHRAGADEGKAKNGGGSRRTISEFDIGRWENGGSDGNLSCNSWDSQANPPSFARRTLLWLMGRQNKVVHSSLDPTI
ncbi:RING-H2 finger protein ATL13 [Argentina anserina]|uniref:RING-H2 finger protein ATL13 n=1 Tax=Argentina anserina TaxID=57926 RepID=UPI002176385B|nr:RING-H2 finger protein ATL13 [Potentilla anserina]